MRNRSGIRSAYLRKASRFHFKPIPGLSTAHHISRHLLYPITSRGRERKATIKSRADRQKYRSCLESTSERYRTAIQCYSRAVLRSDVDLKCGKPEMTHPNG